MIVWRAGRSRQPICRVLLAAGVLAGVAAPLGAQPEQLSEALGSALDAKLVAILEHARTSAAEPRLTPLLESEINSFLKFQGAPLLPVGMTDPTVRIGESRRVTAEAIIDLDVIREQRARSTFDLLQFLGGRLSVSASGTVSSGNGVASVDIESVTVEGVVMPAQVLQELVRYYTRTESHPDGIRIDEAIPLPYNIAELRITPGQAVVVQ